jgi:hypothetical protein
MLVILRIDILYLLIIVVHLGFHLERLKTIRMLRKNIQSITPIVNLAIFNYEAKLFVDLN